MVTIAEVHSTDSNWDLGFRRELNEREKEELVSLFQTIQTVNLTSFPDSRIWVRDPLGFSCKSFFVSLTGGEALSPFEIFKFIWKSCISYRVKVFAWLVVHGKVNTCNLI